VENTTVRELIEFCVLWFMDVLKCLHISLKHVSYVFLFAS